MSAGCALPQVGCDRGCDQQAQCALQSIEEREHHYRAGRESEPHDPFQRSGDEHGRRDRRNHSGADFRANARQQCHRHVVAPALRRLSPRRRRGEVSRPCAPFVRLGRRQWSTPWSSADRHPARLCASAVSSAGSSGPRSLRKPGSPQLDPRRACIQGVRPHHLVRGCDHVPEAGSVGCNTGPLSAGTDTGPEHTRSMHRHASISTPDGVRDQVSALPKVVSDHSDRGECCVA